MFARLLALFLVTPVVELLLLIQLGDMIGFWPTAAIIIVTGVAGSYLAKREGLSAWQRLQTEFGRSGLPGKELLDGAIILIAGALLLTPGVLTDLIGFSGLFPPTRALIRRYAKYRFKRAMKNGTIQTSLGGFGMSAPPPESDAPGASSEWEAEERETGWEGEGRRVPGHAADTSADEIGEAGAGSDER